MKKSFFSSNVAAASIFFVVVLGGVVGWIWNIIKLVGADGIGGMEIARGIGVLVAPLGAVLGWF